VIKRDIIKERKITKLEWPMRYNQIGRVRTAKIEPSETYLHRETKIRKIIPENRHESGEIAKKTPRHVATPFPPLKWL
jgi:hypothetical protein